MKHDQPEQVADVPLDPFADPARGAGSRPLAQDPDAVGADGQPRARTHQQPEHTQETREQRARRCAFHKSCVCDHTICRDGWLDDEIPEPAKLGDWSDHTAVQRCPRCTDAREMTVELAGMKGKR